MVDQATGGILLDVDPRDASKQGTVDPIGRKFRWNSRHEGILCLNERMNDFDAASRIPKNTSTSGDLDTLMIFDPTFCNVTLC